MIWEQLDQRTSESVELSAVFLLYMVLAGIIAAIGIFLDSEILVVGAMVVGPEFGPVAGLCVALVQRRAELAKRSATALAIGFPLAIAATVARHAGLRRARPRSRTTSTSTSHQLASSISSPDAFAFIVAVCAGAAGMLSLSTAKSGALIGVLISVTTIPAAANIGIAAAFGNWHTFAGSTGQLAVNLAGILLAGTLTLYIQRLLYHRRKRRHARAPPSASAARTRARRRPAWRPRSASPPAPSRGASSSVAPSATARVGGRGDVVDLDVGQPERAVRGRALDDPAAEPPPHVEGQIGAVAGVDPVRRPPAQLPVEVACGREVVGVQLEVHDGSLRGADMVTPLDHARPANSSVSGW